MAPVSNYWLDEMFSQEGQAVIADSLQSDTRRWKDQGAGEFSDINDWEVSFRTLCPDLVKHFPYVSNFQSTKSVIKYIVRVE